MKKKYITTPIYYVNDIPHLGHAYTTIAADVLARYYRRKIGDSNVFFMTGTDEHGAKIAEAAGLANKKPKEFCDDLVLRFQKTWQNLNISYNYFLRTTNKKHEKIVQDLLTKIYQKGEIYKKKYEGLYCLGCERFLTKSELIKGKCPDHRTKPVKMSEENYFFQLSKYRRDLIKAIGDYKDKNHYEIMPQSRKNEILSKLKMGLEDVSISRQEVTWGIPIPWDRSQTIYVWIDALINYYSGPQISPRIENCKLKIENLFPADLHLMAKDILWFHGVIWPALCLSAGLDLPKVIFAHGFFTVDGQKMSKTLGNVIDPNDWVKKYGADPVRYYLLTAFPFGEDGDVSEEKLREKYNNELANELGNLVNRVVMMINKFQILKSKLQKNTPEVVGLFQAQPREGLLRGGSNQKVNKLVEQLRFNEALEEIWKIVRQANNYIEKTKPWELANAKAQKEKNRKELEKIFQYLIYNLEFIIYNLSPFLPDTSDKIRNQCQTLKPTPLFPRIKE